MWTTEQIKHWKRIGVLPREYETQDKTTQRKPNETNPSALQSANDLPIWIRAVIFGGDSETKQ